MTFLGWVSRRDRLEGWLNVGDLQLGDLRCCRELNYLRNGSFRMVNRRFCFLKRISESDFPRKTSSNWKWRSGTKKRLMQEIVPLKYLKSFSNCKVSTQVFSSRWPRAPTVGVPTTTPGLQKENEWMDTQNDAIFDECFKPSFLVSMLDFGGVYQQQCFKW